MGQKSLTLTQQRIIDKLSTLLLTEEESLYCLVIVPEEVVKVAGSHREFETVLM